MRFKPRMPPADLVVTETTVPDDVEAVGNSSLQGKSHVTGQSEGESDGGSDVITKEFQHGVQSAQAINQLWTTKHLVMAYLMSVKIAIIFSGTKHW